MRFIPTLAHGLLDYIVGGLLVVLPLVVNFGPGMPTRFPVLMGVAVLGYGVFTDFELGVRKFISMSAHLMLDAVAGLLLATSPLFIPYAERTWLVPVAVGCIKLGSALFTRTSPFYGPELPSHPPVV